MTGYLLAGEQVLVYSSVPCPYGNPGHWIKKGGLGQETNDTPISNNNFYFILLYTL